MPKQHPRTEKHLIDVIDLYYFGYDGSNASEEDEQLDMTQYMQVDESSDGDVDVKDSDDDESEVEDGHQMHLRIMDLVRGFAGEDGHDVSVDWDAPGVHSSEDGVLDIDVDGVDLDEYVLSEFGLSRQQLERDDNHNHL